MRRFTLVVTLALTAAFAAVQVGCSSSGGGGSGTGGSSGGNGGATATGGTGNGGASAGGASSGGTGPTGGTAGGGATGTGGGAGAGGSGTGGGAGRAGSGGNAGSGGGTCAECGFCPATPPTDGTPCALPPGLQYWACTFTNDPDLTCRPQSQCSCTLANGAGCTDPTLATWRTSAPPARCTTLDPGCGATPADACTAIAARCPYPDGTVCACNEAGKPCTPLIGGAPGLVPPCPNVVPNAGTSCDLPDGTICGQNTCDISSTGFGKATCSGGVWRWTNCLPHVCAAPDTPIATPDGERAIADLRVGDLVYSVDGRALRPVPIARVRSQEVHDHRIVRVSLEGGRVLELSGPHPTSDGRTFAELRAGETLDGRRMIGVEVVPYAHDRTYDILPASDTGFYIAGGVLVGSSLFLHQDPHQDLHQDLHQASVSWCPL